MDEYTVEITETLRREVKVKADDVDEALDKVKMMYQNSEVVLGEQDFDGTVAISCDGKEVTPW